MSFDIWSNFQNIFTYATDSFSKLDIWFYPLIFLAIIGWVYASVQSVTVMIVAILITFGLYATTTSIFVDVPDVSLFLYIITLLGLSMLIATLFIKRWHQ